MEAKKYTEEQIIGALREADAGVKVEDVCRRLGVSQVTFYRWKAKFSGMQVSDAKRLRQLEDENRTAMRQAVGYLQDEFKMSQRRACRVLGFCRSSAQYISRREPSAELVSMLIRSFPPWSLRASTTRSQPQERPGEHFLSMNNVLRQHS